VDAHLLRRLAAEVDDEHRESMRTIVDDLAPLGRRALAGAFVGVGTLLLGASRASAVTTTLPPRQPDEADTSVLVFAQSLELAAVAAYDVALASNLLEPGPAAVAGLFRSHHLEHAQAMAGAAGKAAKNTANKAILKKFGPVLQAAKSQADMLAAAFGLENAAAATYGQALGTLKATDSASLVASIQPVEARHATVLARVLGLNPADYLLDFDGGAKSALAPSAYAIEG
jgi:Ferritin-like domain